MYRILLRTIIFIGIVSLAIYYLWVLTLYKKTDVSDAFRSYYLDKTSRFYEWSQDQYIIPGRIWNTFWERPSFLSRGELEAPDSSGLGMLLKGPTHLRFKLHQTPPKMFLKLRVHAPKGASVTLGAKEELLKSEIVTPGVHDISFPVTEKLISGVPGKLEDLELKTDRPVYILNIGFIL